MQPFCRIASHTSEEVREILSTLETVFQPLLPQLTLRRWTSSIYDWLTQAPLDPTRSGRVTMDNLMRLVIPALEWSYEAKAPDVQASFLERAAEWLVLRHDTLWIIDGTGPEALPQGLNQREVPDANGKDGTKPAVSENAVPHAPSTVEQREAVETAQEQEPSPKTANCSFGGVVRIDLQRFIDSGINLVECPLCGRMRSLTPVKGVLRFKAHPPLKQQTKHPAKRWSTTGKPDWEVVGG